MREYNLNGGSNLPVKTDTIGKMKDFLFQEIDLTAPVVLKLTPGEEKFLAGTYDFLFQEVKWSDFHDFLFQEVDFKPLRDFLFQEVIFTK